MNENIEWCLKHDKEFNVKICKNSKRVIENRNLKKLALSIKVVYNNK